MDTNNMGPLTGHCAVGDGMRYFFTRLLMSFAIIILSPLVIAGMVFIVWSKE
jgi:hypothetical protein